MPPRPEGIFSWRFHVSHHLRLHLLLLLISLVFMRLYPAAKRLCMLMKSQLNEHFAHHVCLYVCMFVSSTKGMGSYEAPGG